MPIERSLSAVAIAATLAIGTVGCDRSESHSDGPDAHAHASDGATDSHTHADGTTHQGPDAHHAQGGPPASAPPASGTHTNAHGSVHGDHGASSSTDDHTVVPLPEAALGDLTIQVGQGHGVVAAGKEGHLVVSLPHDDNGATVVRAWIGTEDRTLSYVGRGDYSAAAKVYDIHAMAPDPLPTNAQWWIEIERPDGQKLVGSTTAKTR